MVRDEDIRTVILDLVRERGPDKSICPSEAAKILAPDQWQNLMKPVRRAALELQAEGQISILRKGRPVSADDVRGVIRLSLPRP